ncbi:MAG: hypothetical protein ABIO45_04570 [Burkholderiaceae bacterium]
METFDFLTVAHVALGALIAFGGCRLWYGRKLKVSAARVQKLHADRETLQEQVKQARLQLGQLQQDLAARVKAESNALRQRSVTAAEHKAKADAAAEVKARLKAQVEIPTGTVFEASQSPAHGFADTMPFEDK